MNKTPVGEVNNFRVIIRQQVHLFTLYHHILDFV